MTHASVNTRRLRVLVDARIPQDSWGGVQQVVQGLAHGFAEIAHELELIFLVRRGESDWLAPYLGSNARIAEAPADFGMSWRRTAFERVRRSHVLAASILDRSGGILSRMPIPIPRSRGLLESFEPDLVHFATQQGLLTAIPSIYQPHDLLHLHYPELLTPAQVAYRDRAYRAFCDQASLIAVMTEWGRVDLSSAFGIPEERIAVVPWAPVVGIGSTAGEPIAELPERFLLYPAQTWLHKNHLRLLAAIRLAADHGTHVHLVCTGRQNEHFDRIREQARELGIEPQVSFLGYVAQGAMPGLYRRATALIYPSLFEGWGLPVVEAFGFDLPVLAANSTVLPEVVAGAALTFDPTDIGEMSQAIERIWNEETLRAELQAAGRRRVAELSWHRTASIFQALYRRVAGTVLSVEDEQLLRPPTMIQ